MVEFRVDVVIDPSKAVRGTKDIDAQLARIEKRGQNAGRAIGNAFRGIVAALAVREVARAVDTYQNLQNRLRVVTSSTDELIERQEQLRQVAEDTRSSFAGTVTIYSRLAQQAEQLGRSQNELIQFTRSLNQAIAISGASAEESRNALIQLSQGIASGALRGDELRSVLEQLPVVADVIAKKLGVTRGELRLLGQDGKITSDVIIDAFADARGELEDRFGETLPTLGQELVRVKDEVVLFVGELATISGVAAGAGASLKFIAETAKTFREALTSFNQRVRTAEGEARLNAIGAQINFVRREIRALEEREVVSPAALDRLQFLREELDRLTGAAKGATQAVTPEEIETRRQQRRGPTQEEIKADERRRELIQGIVLDLQSEHEQLLLVTSGNERLSGVIEKIQDLRNKNVSLTQEEAQALVDLEQRNEALRRQVTLQQDVIRPLQEEIELQAILSTGQESLAEAYAIYLDLRRQGITLTSQEAAALATLTAQVQTVRDLASAYQDVFGQQDSIRRQIEALETLRGRAAAGGDATGVDMIQRRIEELRIKALESATDIGSGFERAFLKMRMEANDFAAAAEGIFNTVVDHASDAFIDFIETGKFSFKEFASSLIRDINRIIARMIILQLIEQGISLLGGGAGGAVRTGAGLASGLAGGRQHGGPVSAGRSYLVGEGGQPEIFTPNQSGRVTPVGKMSMEPPQVNVQAVIVQNQDLVPDAISNGRATDSLVIDMNANRDRYRQALGIA